MNEDTNKELEQVQNIDNSVENNNIENNNVADNANVSDVNTNINETGVVSEVSFDYKDEVVVEKEEKHEEPVVVQEVSSVEVKTSLEEVSVNGNDGFLDTTEASENSVFNEKKQEENSVGSMKEGGEKAVQKKGFPYGMVIVVVLVIVFVFSMDFIAEFIEREVINKEKEIIEEKEKNDSDSLNNSDKNKENNSDKKDEVVEGNNSTNNGE